MATPGKDKRGRPVIVMYPDEWQNLCDLIREASYIIRHGADDERRRDWVEHADATALATKLRKALGA